jgi:hypothetical protein
VCTSWNTYTPFSSGGEKVGSKQLRCQALTGCHSLEDLGGHKQVLHLDTRHKCLAPGLSSYVGRQGIQVNTLAVPPSGTTALTPEALADTPTPELADAHTPEDVDLACDRGILHHRHHPGLEAGRP